MYATALLCGGFLGAAAQATEPPTAEQMAGWSAEQWADVAIAESFKVEGNTRLEIQAYACQALAALPARRSDVLKMFDDARAVLDNLRTDDLEEEFAEVRGQWVYALSRLGEDARIDEFIGSDDKPAMRMSVLLQAVWGAVESGDTERAGRRLAEMDRGLELLAPQARDSVSVSVAFIHLFVEAPHVAEQHLEALNDPSMKLLGLYAGAGLALDLGQRDVAEQWLARAESLIAAHPDGATENAPYRAVVHARLGRFARAEGFAGDLIEFERVWAWCNVAAAYHRAGHSEKADWWLSQSLGITSGQRAHGQWRTPTEVALQWAELGQGYRACHRFEGLAEVWERAETPLNRGMLAARIAKAMTWEQWVAQQAASIND
ncbi:MAG: hypothetical protein AAF333_00255 [Planctomycetota bacterium]